MPALSVITPVFNSERYLASALDSVAAIGADHEHIVVDGASTDGTRDLLEARQDERLSWSSEPDRGQTHAVNKGLERASGEILGWLNGDDEYIPEAVDRAVAAMLDDPGIDAVYGGMHVLDEAGDVRRRYQPAGWSWRRYLFMGDYIPTPSILFRRRRLEAVGYLDETYADAADYDFYLRLFHRARVQPRPDALIRFRYHPASKTATDVWLQQDEALRIRLAWARGAPDRLCMTGFDRAKRLVLPRISPWPRLYG